MIINLLKINFEDNPLFFPFPMVLIASLAISTWSKICQPAIKAPWVLEIVLERTHFNLQATSQDFHNSLKQELLNEQSLLVYKETLQSNLEEN